MAEGTGVAAIAADQLSMDLADYAAVDAAFHLTTYYMALTEKALNGIATKVPPTLNEPYKGLKDRIQAIRTDMRDRINKFYQAKGDPYVKITQLDTVERLCMPI